MNTPRWKPSVTVAAVIARDGRYLLVEEDTADGLRLNTPAGHLEPGESPQDGAVREALAALAAEGLVVAQPQGHPRRYKPCPGKSLT